MHPELKKTKGCFPVRTSVSAGGEEEEKGHGVHNRLCLRRGVKVSEAATPSIPME